MNEVDKSLKGSDHRFGVFGGRYVPETLMPALEKLETAYEEIRGDEEFKKRLELFYRDYVGLSLIHISEPTRPY